MRWRRGLKKGEGQRKRSRGERGRDGGQGKMGGGEEKRKVAERTLQAERLVWQGPWSPA